LDNVGYFSRVPEDCCIKSIIPVNLQEVEKGLLARIASFAYILSAWSNYKLSNMKNLSKIEYLEEH
jgi:hypothetical protein